MDLLLIVFAVTIIGKRMCLPTGAATVGALLQGPRSVELRGVEFGCCNPIARSGGGGSMRYRWVTSLLSHVASRRESSHPSLAT